MSEITRGEMTQLMAEWASKDPNYRKALLADPKKVLEAQMQRKIPDNVKVKVVEETPDTVYLIAPYVAQQGELSDSDLERVAGGNKKGGSDSSGSDNQNTYTCNDTKGVGTRVQITTQASLFG